MKNKYKLIPMEEIDPEARRIAVLWVEGFGRSNDIMEKHKLASDIMNYAEDYHQRKTGEKKTADVQYAIALLDNAKMSYNHSLNNPEWASTGSEFHTQTRKEYTEKRDSLWEAIKILMEYQSSNYSDSSPSNIE